MNLKRKKTYSMLFVLLITLMIATIVMIPVRSDAESPQATVRIECPGPYWGTITGDETENIEWEGDGDFQVNGEIIFVIMTKASDDHSEMKISILVDGNTRMSKSTSDPEGEIRMSYSLGAEGDVLDEDEGEGSGCVSVLSGSILLILAGFVVVARIRR